MHGIDSMILPKKIAGKCRPDKLVRLILLFDERGFNHNDNKLILGKKMMEFTEQ